MNPMQVGVNYPWFDYGWDFGDAPPGWRDSGPRWAEVIDADLRRLHDLGISVVRWFVLADGLAYGTGDRAPRVDDRGGWHFDPPPLPGRIAVDFDALLMRVDAFNASVEVPIRLLPVLVDFHFALPGEPIRRPDPSAPSGTIEDPAWVKGGRHEAIADPHKRRVVLAEALDRLLAVSRGHPQAIYAWEPINEPEWVTSGWHPDGRRSHPVDEPAMRTFIEGANHRIREAGFQTTVGFARRETITRSGIIAGVNQFHHYPEGRRRLRRHDFHDGTPGIIGEVATRLDDVWPDVARANQRVLDRLRHAERQRYPLTMLWSFRQEDRHSSWTPEVEADVRQFTTEGTGRHRRMRTNPPRRRMEG